jgi:hypothetical protein
MIEKSAESTDDFHPTQKTSIIKLALFVNLAQLIYTVMDSLNKDMLVERGATVLDSLFMRSFLLLIFTFSQT